MNLLLLLQPSFVNVSRGVLIYLAVCWFTDSIFTQRLNRAVEKQNACGDNMGQQRSKLMLKRDNWEIIFQTVLKNILVSFSFSFCFPFVVFLKKFLRDLASRKA